MTDTPTPPDPYGQPPQTISYYSQFPEDNARSLIRLAVIFNYISVGLDAILFLACLGLGTLFFLVPDISKDPGDPPGWVMGLVYTAFALFGAIIALFKLIGTRKLQVGGRSAWGWGLATGIIGTTQFACMSCCCLQVAAGVYTIVILCFANVRAYLANREIPASNWSNP